MGTRLKSTSCSHATKSCDVTIHNKNIGVLNVPMFMKHKTKNILNELLNNVETAVCSPRYEIKIWIDVLRAAMPAKLKKKTLQFSAHKIIYWIYRSAASIVTTHFEKLRNLETFIRSVLILGTKSAHLIVDIYARKKLFRV